MSRRLALAAALSAALATACNALLGIDPPNAVDASAPRDATAADRTRAPDRGGDDVRHDAPPSDAPCSPDAQGDPHNCGRCGHDCGGGACVSGVCQPVALYMGAETPLGLLVDGTSLYVTAGLVAGTGSVFRCTTTSCGAMRTLASGLYQPQTPLAAAGTVFWQNSGALDDAGTVVVPGDTMSCPGGGCPKSGPQRYTGSGGALSGLAMDATNLYWADQTFGGVYTCAIAGCTPTALAGGQPISLVVDGKILYWTDAGTNQVLRCTLPMCSDRGVFADNQPAVWGLAPSTDDVYWTLADNPGQVLSCPKKAPCVAAGSAHVIATGQQNPSFVAADSSGVYWSNYGDGTIMACPAAGCSAPVQLAKLGGFAYAIALDAESVYFSGQGGLGGEVQRVAKP